MEEQFGIIKMMQRHGDGDYVLGISADTIRKKSQSDCQDETSLVPITHKNKILSYSKDIALVSLSAQIMIFPIIAYTYNTVSITFIITNILTSYLIGLIIIFGFLLILISFPFLGLAVSLGKIYKVLIDLLLFITEKTAKLPFSKIYVKTPYIWEIILYYFLIFFLLHLYKKFRETRVNA